MPDSSIPLSDQWLAEKVNSLDPNSLAGALARKLYGGAETGVAAASSIPAYIGGLGTAGINALRGADPAQGYDYGSNKVQFSPQSEEGQNMAQRLVGALQNLPPQIGGEEGNIMAGALHHVANPQTAAVMALASKVAPERLEDFQKLIKNGVPSEEAYARTRLLPLMERTGGLEATSHANDAWAVADPHQRMDPRIVQELQRNPNSVTNFPLGEAYPSSVLEKHYPELVKREVQLGYAPSSLHSASYGGEFDPDTKIIRAIQPELYGPQGVEGTLGHEVTHAVQDAESLPNGGNPDDMRYRLMLALRDAKNNEGISTWYNDRLSPLASKQGMTSGFKLYRGLHGEQVAEAGANATGAETAAPRFTTPFAKQILSPHEMASGAYYDRLQALRQLYESGKYQNMGRENPWLDLNK